MTGGK